MPAILEVPDETPAMKDAIMGEEVKKRRLTRRKSAAGERGSAPPNGDAEARGRGSGVVPVGSKKEARRLLQEHQAVDGHHHQAVLADRTRHAVSLRRTLRHNHHGHGTQRREEHAGAEASAQRERTDSWKGAHVGTASDLGLGRTHCGPPEAGDGSGSGQRGDTAWYLRQFDGMSMDAKCDHARFCRVDRTYQSGQARITLSVDRSGVRDSVVSALQQLGAARKYARALPTQLARDLQQWLDTLLDK